MRHTGKPDSGQAVRLFFPVSVSGLLLLLCFFFAGFSAQAQNSNSIGSGNWNNPAVWLGGIVPTGSNEVYINSGHTITLVANTTTSNVVSVTGTLAMAGFNLDAGSITGSGTIRTSSGTPVLTIGSANGNFAFGGIIGPGAITLTKTGTGIFSVSADNTYTGNTSIVAGSIRMLGANAFGSTGSVTVSSGAALQLEGSISVNRNITINGTGVSTDGAIRNNSGNNILTGTVTLASAGSIVNAGGTLTMDGATAIAGSTFALTLGGTATTTINGIISGSGLFTKEGTGVLNLNAVNTFSGNKVITGGAINVQQPDALGTAGSITVNSGAAFQIQGGITFARPITINGTGVGTTGAIRNISGDNILSGLITLGSASRIHSDAGNLSLTAATAVSGSGNNLTLGGNATVTISGTIATVAGAVIKENNGTAIFTVANTYTGGTTISAGAINMRHASALGTSGTITVNSGGTLQLENNITVSRVLNINGNGASSTGAIRSISGTNTISSTIQMGAASRINVDAGTLTLSNANAVNATNQNLSLGGAANLAVSGTLTIGSGNLAKDGAGTLSLAVASTYTGTTTISAGIVTFGNINAFGTTGTISVTGSGSLQLSGGITFARPLSISSTVSTGALRNVSGSNTISATVTLIGSNTRINSDAGTLTLSNANSINGTNQTLVVGGSGNTTFSGTLTQGTGGLTKDGAGTATLAVPNSFTGITTVNAGNLVYGTNNILATGNVTVSGGTLNIGAFSDTVGTITISSGSITGSGTLYSTDDFNFSGGTISTVLGGSSGLIKTGTGTLTLTGANTFTGQVWIQNGTISVSSLNNVVGGNPSSNLGAPTTVDNGMIRFGLGTADGTLLYTGTGETSDRRFELAGGNGGNGTVQNNGSGPLVLSGDVVSDAVGTSTFFLRGTNTGNNIFSGEIQENTGTGSTAFSKQDAGYWILTRSNGFFGSVTINGGNLRIEADGALGQGSLITISSGSLNLAPSVGVLTITQDITVTGTGVPANTGAITNVNGNNIIAGVVSLSGTTRFNSDADSLLFTALPTSIRSNNGTNRTLTMGGSGHQRVAGELEHGGTATFTKDGSGTLVIQTSRTTAGQFNLNLGTLLLGAENALNTGTYLSFANTASLTLDLNGYNHTFNGIQGSNTGSVITSSRAGNCTITVNNTTSRSLAARIENGSGTVHIHKLGTADWTLTNAASTFSGQVYVGGGRLVVSNVIANSGTNSSIGTGNTTATITLENGGIFAYTSTTARSTNRPFQIIGSGTIQRNANTTNAMTLNGAINGTNTDLTLEPTGGTNRNLIVNSVITLGTGTLTQTGAGNTTLNAANSYTGNTIISQGTLTIGDDAAIPSGSLVNNTSTLNLNGHDITVAGITGTDTLAEVRNNNAGAASITLSSTSGDITYSGRILNGTGTLSVIKLGAFTQRLGGVNTYTGSTTINAGVLKAVSATAISANSAFTIGNVAGATLDIQGFNNSIGSLAGGGTTGGNVLLGTATLSIGSNNSSTAYAGTITGIGTGGVEKVGSGVFTFSGTPDYPGLTIVSAGTFQAGGDLIFQGVVSISTGGLFDCDVYQSSAFYISFNSLRQVSGSWGSLASPATNKNNTYFTNASTGILIALDGIVNGYWLGATSTDWFTTTNWHNGFIPDQNTKAVIEYVAINAPDITGTATCGDMEIFPAASVTVSGTNVIEVYGDWLNYGTFVPNSSTVNFRKASGVTQVITRPTYGPFANLQYFGTGTLRLSSNEPLPFNMTGALITNSGNTVDLNGKGLLCAGLAGPGTITNSQPFDVQIQISGTTDRTFSGTIQNGSGTVGLTKTGSMVQVLEGGNTFSGGIVISGGELLARNTATAMGSGGITLSGTSPVLRLSNTSGSGLNFARPVTVNVAAEIISDNNSSGAGASHTLGALTLNSTALTISGGGNVTSGTAGITFGAVSHSVSPTYTVTNPVGGGITQLSLGALTGSTFPVIMAGSGDIVQTGAFSISPATATESAINYQGTGTLTLSQANTMTQRLTLTSGTIVATNNAGALGSATTVYLSGGFLFLRNNTGLAFNNAVNITVNATILTDRTSAGAGVNHTLGNITFTSPTDSLRITNGSNVTSGTGSVTAGTATLNRLTYFTIDTLSNLTLAGFINNQQTNKMGSGQLTLNGSSTKTTAANTLTDGILRVESASGLATGTATLNIDGGQLVFANGANTTFTGTNLLLRAASSRITIDRTTAAATDVTHTVNQISWNGSNLELLLDKGSNITNPATGVLQTTTLVQNTNGRTYNYNVMAGARFLMPGMTLTNNQTVNYRGQGEVGQMAGATLVTATGTSWNQLGSGSLIFSGTNSLQGPVTVDSGDVRTETNPQQFRTLNINTPGRFHPVTDNAFTLSLFFNGVRQSPRLYGSQSSVAQWRSDTLFTPGITAMLGLKGYLEFLTQPIGGRSSLLFASPPVVQVRDSLGVLIDNSENTSPVLAYLSRTDADGRGRLRGDSLELMVNDRATFDSLRIGGRVDSIYRIAFIIDSLVTPALESGNITVTPGPIDPGLSAVVFSVDTAIANGTDSVIVSTTLMDIDSNVIANELVSLTQDSGKASVIVAENFSYSNANGLARFAVSSTVADSIDYFAVVQFGDDEPFSGTARVYFVPGPPYRLAYINQPYSAPINTVFFPPIRVAIYDSNDNQMWTDTNVVSLSLFPLSFISGFSSVTENGGLAEFPLISIANGGTYIMIASLDTLTVNSLDFDIIENYYTGGNGDGHFMNASRKQNLAGKYVITLGGSFVAQDKIYDGTINLGTGGIVSSTLALDGLDIAYDDVTVDSVRYSFLSPAVGDNKLVIIDTVLLGGADTSEYIFSLFDAPTGTVKILGQSFFGGDGRGDVLAQSDTVFLDGVKAVPTKIVFESQPGDQLANSPISLQASIRAANNRLVPFGATSATISLFSNPGSATLGGTLSQPFTGGRAIFNDLSINRGSSAYQLGIEPAAPLTHALDTAVTNPFDVYAVFSGGEGRGDTALSIFSRGLDGKFYDGWVGGSSGNPDNWFTAGNWSSGRTPLDTSNIIIPLRPYLPVLYRSVNPAENGFLLASAGSMIFYDQTQLTLDSGTSTAKGPLFKLSAGSTVETRGNSRIVLEPGARYVNLSTGRPQLEVKQLLTGYKGWRLLSSPVATTYADFLDSLETQGYSGAKYDSLQPNILWFAETDTGTTLQNWRQPVTASDSVLAGRGHFAYIFNGAGRPSRVQEGGNYRDTLPIVLSATGQEPDLSGGTYFTFNNLSFTPRALSTAADTVGGNRLFLDENVADAGWNMLGNPTASVLDWDATSGAWDLSNVDNTLYIWDPSFGSGTGGYRYWNGSVGNINDTTLETGLLAPFQAFWIHANNTNPLLRFNNDAKSDSSAQYHGRTTGTPPSVALTLQGEGMEANSYLSFGYEGITGPDIYDAYQLESYNDDWLMLYSNSSIQHRKPLVINHLPADVDQELAIPLHISAARNRAPLSGGYQISWKLSDNWPANWTVALMDHHNELAIPMLERTSHTFSYQAPVQPEARVAGSETGDFRSPSTVLHGNNSDGMPLFRQQREPVRPFTIILIPNYDGGTIAYRPDHAYVYPPSPNPFTDETRLSFYLPEATDATIEVIDLHGRVVLRQNRQLYAAGTHDLIWNGDRVSAGTYVVRLITEDFVSTQKAVKVK